MVSKSRQLNLMNIPCSTRLENPHQLARDQSCSAWFLAASNCDSLRDNARWSGHVNRLIDAVLMLFDSLKRGRAEMPELYLDNHVPLALPASQTLS